MLWFAGTAQAEVRVRAAGDSVRIEPTTVTLIEGGPALGRDGVAADYLDDNPVFNVERGSLRLQGAGGETVAFQVILETDGPPISDIEIRFDELVKGGSRLGGANIRLYRQWYVELPGPSEHEQAVVATNRLEAWFPVSRYSPRLVNSLGSGWYPDALIPMEGEIWRRHGRELSKIPSQLNHVPQQRAQAYWIDVWIPPNLPAGVYSNELSLSWRGGSMSLPVRLDVLPIQLSQDFEAGIGSVSYDFVGVRLAEAGPRPLQDFYRLMHRHRMTLDALYLHPDWNGGQIDWRGYDELVGPLLDGRAFSENSGYVGPGQDRPVKRFVLPLDWNWPTNPESQSVEAYNRHFVEAGRATFEHIEARGWTETEWHLFINRTDEPRTVEAFEELRRYGQLFGSVRDGFEFDALHRIDAGPFKAIDREIPGWNVERIFEEIGDVVDVWNVCGGVPFIGVRELAGRIERHPNEQAWFYFSNAAGEPAVGSLLIDGEALGPRTWGWILYRYGFQAGVSWEVGWPSEDCLVASACSGYGLHGDASLVYLADRLGFENVVLPSIRLKGLRRGAEDAAYLRLLEERGFGQYAQAWARRLVPAALDDRLLPRMNGVWEHDPAQWERVRRQMGAVLAGEREPPPLAEIEAATPSFLPTTSGVSRRISYVAMLLFVLILVAAVSLSERRRKRA